jgi:hypothetical protein
MSGNLGLNFFIAGGGTLPAATTARIKLIHPRRAAAVSGLKPAHIPISQQSIPKLKLLTSANPKSNVHTLFSARHRH